MGAHAVTTDLYCDADEAEEVEREEADENLVELVHC